MPTPAQNEPQDEARLDALARDIPPIQYEHTDPDPITTLNKDASSKGRTALRRQYEKENESLEAKLAELVEDTSLAIGMEDLADAMERMHPDESYEVQRLAGEVYAIVDGNPMLERALASKVSNEFSIAQSQNRVNHAKLEGKHQGLREEHTKRERRYLEIIREYQSKNEDLIKLNDNSAQEKGILIEQTNDLNNLYNRAQAQREILEKDCNGLREQLKELETDEERHKRSQNGSEAGVERLESDIQGLKLALDQAGEELKKEQEKAKKNAADAATKLDDEKARQEKLEAKHVQILKDERQKVDDRIMDKETIRKLMQQQIDDALNQNSVLTKQVVALNQQKEDDSRNISSLQVKAGRLENQMNQARELNESKDGELQAIMEEVAEQKSTVDNLQEVFVLATSHDAELNFDILEWIRIDYRVSADQVYTAAAKWLSNPFTPQVTSPEHAHFEAFELWILSMTAPELLSHRRLTMFVSSAKTKFNDKRALGFLVGAAQALQFEKHLTLHESEFVIKLEEFFLELYTGSRAPQAVLELFEILRPNTTVHHPAMEAAKTWCSGGKTYEQCTVDILQAASAVRLPGGAWARQVAGTNDIIVADSSSVRRFSMDDIRITRPRNELLSVSIHGYPAFGSEEPRSLPAKELSSLDRAFPTFDWDTWGSTNDP